MGPPVPDERRHGGSRPGERYGAPPQNSPGSPAPSPWADRTTRPTGTVPWAGRSGGWEDLFTGTGGSSRGSGTPPSGADVARALVEMLRRGLRGR